MLFSLLAQVRNDSAVFCWAQSHLHLTHDVICMMKRFRGIASQLQLVTKHLLCFCFLLPINLCVLRPFQGALWHAWNFPHYPLLFYSSYSSSSLVSSLISLYTRHQSTRTDTLNSILNSLSSSSLTEVFLYMTSWQIQMKGVRMATWLLQTKVWWVRVTTWLAQGRFDWGCDDGCLVQRPEHAYWLIACLASVYWVHNNRGALRFFSKANGEHVWRGLSLWRFKKGRIPLRP